MYNNNNKNGLGHSAWKVTITITTPIQIISCHLANNFFGALSLYNFDNDYDLKQNTNIKIQIYEISIFVG